MTLTVLDPCTGTRVTITVPDRPESDRRARRWVLRELDRSAAYVDKLVHGALPADLPVEQPTRFEFLVNLTAANALGITLPSQVLSRADELIE